MSVETLERPVDLRRFAGQFPTGVAVITTCDAAGKGHGITMSALTSLSLEPPLFLICLNKTSKTLAAVKTSGHLCINFLSAEQTLLLATCAPRRRPPIRTALSQPNTAGFAPPPTAG